MRRRQFLTTLAAAVPASISTRSLEAGNVAATAPDDSARRRGPLTIKRMTAIPVALPDPPLLAAGGCHGPYFLRTIIRLETEGGIVGTAETRGGTRVLDALESIRDAVVGKDAFAARKLVTLFRDDAPASAFAGLELACLDACGRATGLRLCDLLSGPVRDRVEFAAYLFYRYAADDPRILADERIVDGPRRGESRLDHWGEIRSPEAMRKLATAFHQEFGFRTFKLKAGVFPPDEELEALRQMNAHFQSSPIAKQFALRIDPNGRWTVPTAIRIGKQMTDLRLEYYEDPVIGQEAMSEVRRETKLKMSTNMCVTEFEHIPNAIRTQPIDVVLCDHHGWGGISACVELSRICQVLGWTMSQHSNNHAGITMAAMIHVGALCRELTSPSDTHYPWLAPAFDIIEGGKLPIRDGHMELPSGPGTGVTPDLDQIHRAHETWKKCGMRDRDDALLMQRLVPDWDVAKKF